MIFHLLNLFKGSCCVGNPSTAYFVCNICRYRHHYTAINGELCPNLRIHLQIACTIPATSCECERSASALRRLNKYTRASIGKERMANLALLHIHYDKRWMSIGWLIYILQSSIKKNGIELLISPFKIVKTVS